MSFWSRAALSLVLAVLVAGSIAAAARTQTRPAPQPLRVMIVSRFTTADLSRLASRGAVGLLVPGVGPTVNRRQALAALLRGAVENARLGGVPTGPPLISAQAPSGFPSGEPEIIVALPPKGSPVLNDRRYPIAIVGRGFHGLLLSRTTRLPGVVSIVDIAPTALNRSRAMLLSDGRPGAGAMVARLDARITANNQLKLPALIAILVLGGFLVILRPRAALFAIPAALLGNLGLGIAAPSSIPVLIGGLVLATVFGALALERLAATEARVLVLLAAVVCAYLVAMWVDSTWVAINPLGPTQNSRFFGIGNQLETLLLVPILAGAALAGRRFGWAGFVAFGGLGLFTVADNGFGADGGGAIVLAVALAVLGCRLGRFRAVGLLVALLAGAMSVLGLIWIDGYGGLPNHLHNAFSHGIAGLVAVARNRVPLSYEPALHQWAFVGPFFAAFGITALAALRGRQTPGRREVVLAVVVAVCVSLLVNDSAAYELVAGVISLAALRVSPFSFGPLRRIRLAAPVAVRAPISLAADTAGE